MPSGHAPKRSTRRRIEEWRHQMSRWRASRLVWPSYFADPAAAPPCPDIALDVATLAGTMASVRKHEQAGTLTRRLPDVPSSIPVLFVHGAKSPLPVRTTTMTAELIPHARVEVLPDAGR